MCMFKKNKPYTNSFKKKHQISAYENPSYSKKNFLQ